MLLGLHLDYLYFCLLIRPKKLYSSLSMMVDDAKVGKCTAALMQWSSLVKLLANIFMFLSIFVVSSYNVLFPAAATRSKMSRFIVEYSPVDVLHATASNILKP